MAAAGAATSTPAFGNNSAYQFVNGDDTYQSVDEYGYDVKGAGVNSSSAGSHSRDSSDFSPLRASEAATQYATGGEEDELHIVNSAQRAMVGPSVSVSPEEGSTERRTADAYNAIFTAICGLAAFFACGAMTPVLTFSATAIGVFFASASGEGREECPAALPSTLAVVSLVITIAGAKAFPFLPVLRHIVPLACNSYAVKLAVQLAWGEPASSTAGASSDVPY